ncbi:hypothetical protein AURDEDRAFT_159267 [Auricularia subglabra TFB-10046 SS5]|nr:hypothetical protein AURDEDRAFT_159267 [Auricularia subglabra TFB-10046 SS5]
MDPETLSWLLSQMPLLRELHLLLLEQESRQVPGHHIITRQPGSVLEYYRMQSVFACSVVPLLFCHDTLRHIGITLRHKDDPEAREALIDTLRRTTFRRLQSLRLDIRDDRMPEALAICLLEACPAVRMLELYVRMVDAYENFDTILRTCPRGLQKLAIVSSSANDRELQNVGTLTRIVDSSALWMPALRELVLRRFSRLADVDDVGPLRDACRNRRIIFRLDSC